MLERPQKLGSEQSTMAAALAAAEQTERVTYASPPHMGLCKGHFGEAAQNLIARCAHYRGVLPSLIPLASDNVNKLRSLGSLALIELTPHRTN